MEEYNENWDTFFCYDEEDEIKDYEDWKTLYFDDEELEEVEPYYIFSSDKSVDLSKYKDVIKNVDEIEIHEKSYLNFIPPNIKKLSILCDQPLNNLQYITELFICPPKFTQPIDFLPNTITKFHITVSSKYQHSFHNLPLSITEFSINYFFEEGEKKDFKFIDWSFLKNMRLKKLKLETDAESHLLLPYQNYRDDNGNIKDEFKEFDKLINKEPLESDLGDLAEIDAINILPSQLPQNCKIEFYGYLHNYDELMEKINFYNNF